MLMNFLLTTEENRLILRKLLIKSLILLIISFLITEALWYSIWSANTAIFHTAIELVCTMTAFALFSVVWHTYDRNSTPINFLGFGFLVVAVLELFHTLYSPELGLNPIGYFDLGSRYWTVARLIEAIIILIVTLRPTQKKFNKRVGLCFALIFSFGISLLLLKFPGIMPTLCIRSIGTTQAKAYITYFIIALSIITLVIMRNSIKNRDKLNYGFIYVSLLITIGADFSLAFYSTKISFLREFGHVCKLISFYYLYKGTVVSAVTYPSEKLEMTNSYMSKILNGLPIGLITLDINRNLTFVNLKAQNMLGYNQNQLQELSNEQASEQINKSLKDFFGKQRSIDSNINSKIVKINNGQGDYVNLRTELQTFKDEGYMYILTDAKKEQELEYLQLQTQIILNSITNLILVLDKNQKIIMCNMAFSEKTELEERDILGIDLLELSQLIDYSFSKITDASKRDVYDTSFVTPSGKRREVLFHKAEVSNIEQESIGYIMVGVDITKLKAEQQKVIQQEKLAVLGQMAAGIVHEIRNPLTAIKGFSQIIKSKTNDSKIRDFATIIEAEANGVNQVVSDFLTYARPRTPVLKPLSLNELISTMGLMLESQLYIKGTRLIIDTSSEEGLVMADDGQIKQVILNMVRNAIDAVKDTKDPMVIIRTEYNNEKEEMILMISDNGHGMSPKEQENIGTPFFTTKEKGTGLGLSVCFQIISQHNGRINIETEVGQGTSFRIVLPCI